MTSDELIGRFAGSPELFVHKVDVAADAALVIGLGPEAYRTATFLDDRALTPSTTGLWIRLFRLSSLVDAISSHRPMHFIWHTGHVGSTLVSRLLDEVAGVLSIREPLPLRTLAEAADTLGSVHALVGAEGLESLARMLASSWARGYDGTRAVVVKATSSAARVAPLLCRQVPTARSVYLNVELEPYLATSLSRGDWPVDLRSYGPERIRRLQSKLPTPLPALWAMSVGELAAMTWLAETVTQREVERELGERVLSLDFDAALADIGGTMQRVLEHLGLSPDAGYAARVAESPVLHRHSKATDTPYSPAARKQTLDQSRQANREEIWKGLVWVDNLVRSNPTAARLLVP